MITCSKKRAVLVAGGGLSGLAAGLALRGQSRGEIDVTLLERRSFAGGKASSAGVTCDGHVFEIEHGLHVFFDYPNFRRLLGEADPGALARIRPAVRGSSFYREGRAPVRVQPLPLPSPLHLLGGRALAKVGGRDALAMGRIALAAMLLRIERLSPAERGRLDALGFDAYARAMGVSALGVGTPFFVTPGRATFCYPEPPSTLAMLRTIRLVQQNREAQATGMLDGSCSEVLVEPLVRALARAGGRLELGRTVTALSTEGRTVRGIVVAPTPPRPTPSDAGASPYAADEGVPAPDAGALREADAYVLAIPPPAIAGVLDAGLRRDPYFGRIARIRTKRTIACQLYFDRDVSAEGPEGLVVGTPDPWSAVFDRLRLWSRPDADPKAPGSVLVFVGEEDSMAGASDAALVAEAERLARTIYPGARDATITRRFFHRSAGDPYFHTPRGSDALRPTVATPLRDLLVAGDFTDNGFDVVGMEGAVVSGLRAANVLLRRWGHPERPILPMSAPGGFVEALRGALEATGLLRAFTGFAESPC